MSKSKSTFKEIASSDNANSDSNGSISDEESDTNEIHNKLKKISTSSTSQLTKIINKKPLLEKKSDSDSESNSGTSNDEEILSKQPIKKEISIPKGKLKKSESSQEQEQEPETISKKVKNSDKKTVTKKQIESKEESDEELDITNKIKLLLEMKEITQNKQILKLVKEIKKYVEPLIKKKIASESRVKKSPTLYSAPTVFCDYVGIDNDEQYQAVTLQKLFCDKLIQNNYQDGKTFKLDSKILKKLDLDISYIENKIPKNKQTNIEFTKDNIICSRPKILAIISCMLQKNK